MSIARDNLMQHILFVAEEDAGLKYVSDAIDALIREARAEALRAAVLLMRACKEHGHWNMRDPLDPETSYSPDCWLEVRADAEEVNHD